MHDTLMHLIYKLFILLRVTVYSYYKSKLNELKEEEEAAYMIKRSPRPRETAKTGELSNL